MVYAANCAACHQKAARARAHQRRSSAIVLRTTTRPDQRCAARDCQRCHPSCEAAVGPDLAAVITYTKNALVNKTGQLIAAAEIVAQRGKVIRVELSGYWERPRSAVLDHPGWRPPA